MGSFDELIEKKVGLDETDRNPEAILLHKDSAMKVTIVYFSPYDHERELIRLLWLLHRRKNSSTDCRQMRRSAPMSSFGSV